MLALERPKYKAQKKIREWEKRVTHLHKSSSLNHNSSHAHVDVCKIKEEKKKRDGEWRVREWMMCTHQNNEIKIWINSWASERKREDRIAYQLPRDCLDILIAVLLLLLLLLL